MNGCKKKRTKRNGYSNRGKERKGKTGKKKGRKRGEHAIEVGAYLCAWVGGVDEISI